MVNGFYQEIIEVRANLCHIPEMTLNPTKFFNQNNVYFLYDTFRENISEGLGSFERYSMRFSEVVDYISLLREKILPVSVLEITQELMFLISKLNLDDVERDILTNSDYLPEFYPTDFTTPFKA